MRAVRHREPRRAGVPREVEIVRRVADHQRLVRPTRQPRPSDAAACPDAAWAGLRRRSASHGTHLRVRCCASARSRPARVLPVATASRIAGRVEFGEQLARAVEQRDLGFAREVVVAVARAQFRIAMRAAVPARRTSSRRPSPARSRSARPRRPEPAARGRGRPAAAPRAMSAVESTSVPSQSKTMSAKRRDAASRIARHRRRPRRGARRSARGPRGSGDSNAIASPVSGCTNAQRDANAGTCASGPAWPAPCSTRSRRTCRRRPAESPGASGARGSGACGPVFSSASSSASGGSWSNHIWRRRKMVSACLAVLLDAHAPLAFLRRELVQRQPHAALFVAPAAAHQHQVALVEAALAQLLVQPDQRRALLGDQQDARRFAVEPVHELQEFGVRAGPRAAARSVPARCRCRRAPPGRTACPARSARRPRTGSAGRPGARESAAAAVAPARPSAPAGRGRTSPSASRASGPTRPLLMRTSPLRRIR